MKTQKTLWRSALRTEPAAKFDSFVKAAQQVERQLTSHDADYEDALHTGRISEALTNGLRRAFIQLRCALDELANEMSNRCDLGTLPTQRRYPIRAVGASQNFQSIIESAMPGLTQKYPEVARRVSELQKLAESDGWLATLTSFTDNPDAVQFRRANARVTLSPVPGEGTQLTVVSESGQFISMYAPILIRDSGAEGQAFYLAAGPGDGEAIAFLNRCIRGVEQVGRV